MIRVAPNRAAIEVKRRGTDIAGSVSVPREARGSFHGLKPEAFPQNLPLCDSSVTAPRKT